MAISKLSILIETLYKGGGAQKAAKDMNALGQATSKSSMIQASHQARTAQLSKVMGQLASDVEKGTISVGQATKDFDAYKKALPVLEVEKAAKHHVGLKEALGHVAIAAGVAGAAMYAAKKAFDLGAEGAQIIQTRDVFDRLAESIGETADAMMGKLRDATMGMVSDTDLMQSSARLVSMGLASTADEAAKLSEIAVTLGAAMGKQATPAMEEFALMLANQSTLRLDTFGISAGKVKARIIELTDTIPGMTRETAFMQATLEQAEISMTNLGDAIKPNEYAKAQAEVQNLKDEFAMLTSKALNPAVTAFGKVLREMREIREEIEKIRKEIHTFELLARRAGITEEQLDNLLDSIIELSEGSRDAATITRRYELAVRALESGYRLTEGGAVAYGIAQDKANTSAENMERIWRRIAERGDAVADATEDVTEEVKKLNTEHGELGAWERRRIYQNLGAAAVQYGEDVAEAEEASQKLREEWRATEGQIVSLYIKYKAGIVAMGDLPKNAIGDVQAFEAAVIAAKNAILGISETSEVEKRAVVEIWLDAQAEATAYKDFISGINDGVDNQDEFWDPYLADVRSLNDELDELDGRETHTTMYLDRIVTEQLSTPGGDPTTPPRGGGPQAHAGADFTVPPGYPNDSYPLRVESGERVQVTPAGKQGKGGGDVYVTVYTGSGNADLIGNKVAGRVAEVLGVRG